jgi:hypothetical protein
VPAKAHGRCVCRLNPDAFAPASFWLVACSSIF